METWGGSGTSHAGPRKFSRDKGNKTQPCPGSELGQDRPDHSPRILGGTRHLPVANPAHTQRFLPFHPEANILGNLKPCMVRPDRLKWENPWNNRSWKGPGPHQHHDQWGTGTTLVIQVSDLIVEGNHPLRAISIQGGWAGYAPQNRRNSGAQSLCACCSCVSHGVQR